MDNETIIKLYRSATDEQVKDELLGQLAGNMKLLIVKIARGINGGEQVTEDQIQTGYEAVFYCLPKYDSTKGMFSTFAYLNILRYLQQKSEGVKSVNWYVNLLKHFIYEHPDWTDEQICKAFKNDYTKTTGGLKLIARIRLGVKLTSLDAEPHYEIPDARNKHKEMESRLDLDKLKLKLNARELFVMEGLLDGETALTLAKKLKVSKELIYSVKEDIAKKLGIQKQSNSKKYNHNNKKEKSEYMKMYFRRKGNQSQRRKE